jgi:hypothetical protein
MGQPDEPPRMSRAEAKLGKRDTGAILGELGDYESRIARLWKLWMPMLIVPIEEAPTRRHEVSL